VPKPSIKLILVPQQDTTGLKGFTLVYDSDCGPCTRFKRAVQFLDSYRNFHFESLIRADEDGLLDTIPRPRRHSSFHIVSPRGTVVSGAQAIPTLIAQLPFGEPVSKFVIHAPGSARALRFIYGVFSRLHDTGSCHYGPGQGPTKPQLTSDSWGFLP